MDDLTLKGFVEDELEWEPRIDAADIGVDLSIQARLRVVLSDFRAFALDVLAQERPATKSIDLLGTKESDRIHIDVKGALDAAPTGIRHPAPVLKRFADEFVGGNRRNRLIPVLNFDRVQRDIHDVTVRGSVGHLDPIPHPDHVVAGDLDAG